jgi:uncharacterized membrane protein
VILFKHSIPIPYWISRGTTGFSILNLLIPALLVHLWLLLLAAGALIVSFLYRFFQAVAWTQWALKQGNRNPLKAIGLVAAVLGFAGAAMWKVLSVAW